MLCLFLMSFSAFALEVAGVKMEDRDRVANTELVLNGAGLRKRAFFQVYAIGLYLPEKRMLAAEAIVATGPKRIAIHMLRDVDALQFVDALKDGMKDNLNETEMKGLDPQITQFSALMNQVKLAKKGFQFALDWIPGSGTLLKLEGSPLGGAIAGEDFYRALLRIWLGDNPVQADLKKALLGEKQ